MRPVTQPRAAGWRGGEGRAQALTRAQARARARAQAQARAQARARARGAEVKEAVRIPVQRLRFFSLYSIRRSKSASFCG